MRRAAFLVVLLLASCGNPLAAEPTPTPTCAEQAAPALTQMQSIAREWDDASKLAGQTPRSALSGQIAALQAVRRKVQDLAVPSCADAVKTALTRSMDATIDAFIAFLGQKPDTEVQAGFRDADQKMQAFTAELAKLHGLQPTAVVVATVIPTAPPTTAPTDSPPHAVTVDLHKRLIIFAGPGPDYPLVEDIMNARTVTFLAVRMVKGDHWYHVQTDGKEGWAVLVGLDAAILDALPQDTSPPPPIPSPTA